MKKFTVIKTDGKVKKVDSFYKACKNCFLDDKIMLGDELVVESKATDTVWNTIPKKFSLGTIIEDFEFIDVFTIRYKGKIIKRDRQGRDFGFFIDNKCLNIIYTKNGAPIALVVTREDK